MYSDNKIAKILFWIGIAEIVICIIAGIVVGRPESSYGDFNVMLMLTFWIGGFISGMFIIGFAEIINNLHDIRENFNIVRDSIQKNKTDSTEKTDSSKLSGYRMKKLD